MGMGGPGKAWEKHRSVGKKDGNVNNGTEARGGSGFVEQVWALLRDRGHRDLSLRHLIRIQLLVLRPIAIVVPRLYQSRNMFL